MGADDGEKGVHVEGEWKMDVDRNKGRWKGFVGYIKL